MTNKDCASGSAMKKLFDTILHKYPLSLLIIFFSDMHKNCMLFQYRRGNRVRRVDHPPWKQKTKEMKKENQTRHATKVILQARLGPMLC